MAKLLDPAEDKREAFLRMAQDWRDHGNDRYRLALEDFGAYLARVDRFRDADQVPPGWVPGTEFWLDDEAGEIVACARLRFWLTPSLEIEGGHIGYDVRPSSRGRGFGTAALRLVLPEARRRGLERVRVTVDSDNLPSIKIIERNGGILSGGAISVKTASPSDSTGETRRADPGCETGQKMESTGMVSIDKAEHYTWGSGCDGWHLVNRPSLSVIRERMPPGASEVRHLHEHARQFFFVIDGTAVLELNGRTHDLRRGEGLEVPPGVPHQIFNRSDEVLELLLVSQPHSHGDRVSA